MSEGATAQAEKRKAHKPAPEVPPEALLRSWRVSLGQYGPTTPDPRRADDKPILALDEAEAWEVFKTRHGILSSDHDAKIEEL